MNTIFCLLFCFGQHIGHVCVCVSASREHIIHVHITYGMGICRWNIALGIILYGQIGGWLHYDCIEHLLCVCESFNACRAHTDAYTPIYRHTPHGVRFSSFAHCVADGWRARSCGGFADFGNPNKNYKINYLHRALSSICVYAARARSRQIRKQ